MRRLAIVSLIAMAVVQLSAYQGALLVPDKTNMTEEENAAYFFISHILNDPPTDTAIVLDVNDIISGYSLDNIDVIWIHTDREPIQFNNSTVLNALQDFLEQGGNLMISYYGLFVGEYMGLLDATVESYTPASYEAKYLVSTLDPHPIFRHIAEWQPDSSYQHRKEPGPSMITVVNHPVVTQRVNFEPVVAPYDTIRYVELKTTYGWPYQGQGDQCVNYPGVCDGERNLYTAEIYLYLVGNGYVLPFPWADVALMSENEGYLGPVAYTVLRNFLNGEARIQPIELPRRGVFILYADVENNQSVDVYVYDVDNDTLIPFLTDPNMDEFAGVLSPDGRYFAYSKAPKSSPEENRHLWILDMNLGIEFEVPTPNSYNGGVRQAEYWHPDGNIIYIEPWHSCIRKFYAVKMDGSDNHLVLDPAAYGDGEATYTKAMTFVNDSVVLFNTQDGCWSPTYEIYKAIYRDGTVDVSTIQQLTNNNVIDWTPVISGDTQRIYFARNHYSYYSPMDAYWMDLEGNNVHQITALADTEGITTIAVVPGLNDVIFVGHELWHGDKNLVAMDTSGNMTFITNTPGIYEVPYVGYVLPTPGIKETEQKTMPFSENLLIYYTGKKLRIRFNLPNERVEKLAIYDVAGRLVKEISINRDGVLKYDADISVLPSGKYLYLITTSKRKISGKFVKF